jgi:hypothetical protein
MSEKIKLTDISDQTSKYRGKLQSLRDKNPNDTKSLIVESEQYGTCLVSEDNFRQFFGGNSTNFHIQYPMYSKGAREVSEGIILSQEQTIKDIKFNSNEFKRFTDLKKFLKEKSTSAVNSLSTFREHRIDLTSYGATNFTKAGVFNFTAGYKQAYTADLKLTAPEQSPKNLTNMELYFDVRWYENGEERNNQYIYSGSQRFHSWENGRFTLPISDRALRISLASRLGVTIRLEGFY